MNRIKFLLLFASTTNLELLVGAQPVNYPPPARESIEWCDIWVSHANETNLPRVLLIGDSITRAYFPGSSGIFWGENIG
jgi:hypothetical protein